MNHIDKYSCTTADNLRFKGDAALTRGTRFHCKACDKHAFQIKGEIDGEAVKSSLKKRHAEQPQPPQKQP